MENEPARCLICKRVLNVPGEPLSNDCGGDCLECMAKMGDPDCERRVAAITLLNGQPRSKQDAAGKPLPVRVYCPSCGKQHIDEGEWATRPHKTHRCQFCGWDWRTANVPTVGVSELPQDAAKEDHGS